MLDIFSWTFNDVFEFERHVLLLEYFVKIIIDILRKQMANLYLDCID